MKKLALIQWEKLRGREVAPPVEYMEKLKSRKAEVGEQKVDADQELLLAIERSLAAGTPEALEPLTLLVESSSSNNDVETISQGARP